MIFFDTETCGLHGPIVLLQYAENDGPIQLYSPWIEPIGQTLETFETLIKNQEGVVGFNLAFDWFHICQMYTTLLLMPDKDTILQDCLEQYAEFEPDGRNGPCIKPVSACDLMLHARKGPYQSTMDRGDIRIRRVPTALAWQLAQELETRIKLKRIYFARRKDKFAKQWQVYDIEDEDGDIDPNFKDIVLKFAPSSALKALAVDALGVKEDSILLFTDVDVDHAFLPMEYGYAPFAKAVGTRHNWKNAWPQVIKHHISHWSFGTLPRKYAAKDVEYTRDLYKHFGSPSLGDDDSTLACMVGAVRWKGFRVDIEGLKALKEKTIKSKIKIVNGEEFKIPTAPAQARYYVTEHMDETEKLIIEDSTKKVLLQEITKWKKGCPDCKETGFLEGSMICSRCNGKRTIDHPSALRALEVLDARQANYEVDLYDKFILAGRFHASFVVIGTLSSRMSGTDGLNAQGIKKTKEVRGKFPLAFSGYKLCGGDFAGFEVTLAEAEYNDENLRRQLLTCELCANEMTFVLAREKYVNLISDVEAFVTWRVKAEAKVKKDKPNYVCKTAEDIKEETVENDFICLTCGSNKGKKIHALFGVHVFPEFDYNGLKATEGTKDDKYTKAKSAVFAMMYGGTEHTLMERLGVEEEVALAALARFHREFPGVAKAQKRVFEDFCSMKQPGGIGTKVEWFEPKDYVDTIFGFRRYFTLENQIAKVLFGLANDPPKAWREIKIRVNRRTDRIQTAGGASQSALYAAAFGLQASNLRAAINHRIQSAGATVTKRVQVAIWNLQPPGINEWIVEPLNVHDEIECPVKPGYEDKVKEAVVKVVESIRPQVPLIKMDWSTGLNSWADKS